MDGRFDRTIAPGQSEQVKLAITTKRSGPFTRKISVLTNDAEHQRESLECAGTVRVPFKMEPRAVFNSVSFGEIQGSADAQRKTVTITRGDGGPLAPELLPSDHPNVQVALREIEPGECYELDVVMSPPWPKNRTVRANLTLKTGVPEAPEDTIRVYARIAPRLRAIPAHLRLPREIKSELERKVRLMWSGGNPGQILEATTSDARMSVRIEEENGQQVVVLQVPADYTPPARGSAFVTVKTDDPEAPTLSIQVYAARRPSIAPPARRATQSPFEVKRRTARPTRPPPAQPPKKPEP